VFVVSLRALAGFVPAWARPIRRHARTGVVPTPAIRACWSTVVPCRGHHRWV